MDLLGTRVALAGLLLLAATVQAAEPAQALFERARSLEAAGKVEAAMAAYRRLIDAHPDLPEPYNNLAVLHARRGELEQARRLLQQALETHASYAAVYRNLRTVNVELARDSYIKALELKTGPHRIEVESLAAIVRPAPAAPRPPAPEPPPAPAAVAAATAAPPAPSPVPAPQPAAAPAAAAAPMPVPQEVADTLQAWAAAWSARDPDLYLSFYDESFRPPRGLDRAAWEARRRERLRRPAWIRVTLSDLRVERLDSDRVRLRLRQRYEADRYADTSIKRFVLWRRPGGWRIVREATLKVERGS